jgi:hypothetical protein
MISFWVNSAGSFGMEQYLLQRAPDLAERIQLRTYESLTPDLQVTAGAHIFSALDQLSPAGRETVAALYDRVAEGCRATRLLNNPRRVSLRYELLGKASAAGINGYAAHRAAESNGARFPVFVREESGHGGPLTALLRSRRELARTLLALRARGFRIADLLVVEFCDLSDREGRFRMAAAYKVGEHIVPAFLLGGRNWMLKYSESEHDERAMRESLTYVQENPHEAWLRRIFALAGVDYGRIDYGVRDDTLQVWEINLSPTLGPSGGPAPPPLAPRPETLLQEARKLYLSGMQQAFRALDPENNAARVLVRLDLALVARMKTERARRRRRQTGLRLLQRLYHHPIFGRPFRAAYSRFLPKPGG